MTLDLAAQLVCGVIGAGLFLSAVCIGAFGARAASELDDQEHELDA